MSEKADLDYVRTHAQAIHKHAQQLLIDFRKLRALRDAIQKTQAIDDIHARELLALLSPEDKMDTTVLPHGSLRAQIHLLQLALTKLRSADRDVVGVLAASNQPDIITIRGYLTDVDHVVDAAQREAERIQKHITTMYGHVQAAITGNRHAGAFLKEYDYLQQSEKEFADIGASALIHARSFGQYVRANPTRNIGQNVASFVIACRYAISLLILTIPLALAQPGGVLEIDDAGMTGTIVFVIAGIGLVGLMAVGSTRIKKLLNLDRDVLELLK